MESQAPIDKYIPAKEFAPFLGDIFQELTNPRKEYIRAKELDSVEDLKELENAINSSVFAGVKNRPSIDIHAIENKPNFSKVLKVWKVQSSIYGEIKKIAIESNNGQLVWIFNVTKYGSFINTVQLKEHVVSKYGVATVPEFKTEFDDLTASFPALEYTAQPLKQIFKRFLEDNLSSLNFGRSLRFNPAYIKLLETHANEIQELIKATPNMLKYESKWKGLRDIGYKEPNLDRIGVFIKDFIIDIVTKLISAKESRNETLYQEYANQWFDFRKEIESYLLRSPSTKESTYTYFPKTLLVNPFLAEIQEPLRIIANRT